MHIYDSKEKNTNQAFNKAEHIFANTLTEQSAPEGSMHETCPCDGACPRCLPVQTKLKISNSNDSYEREADQQAEKQVSENPSISFDRELAGVTVHTDQQAIASAESLQAKAFTIGNDIYFNQNQYNPHSSDGKKLIAHELTHVKQQKKMGQKQIQRATKAEAQAVCNKVLPSPQVPFITKSTGTKGAMTKLGPFTIYAHDSSIWSAVGKMNKSNLVKHYQEIQKNDEPYQRNVIVAIYNYLTKHLVKNPQASLKHFVSNVFGTPKQVTQQTAGTTKIVLGPKENLETHGLSLGKIVNKKTSNPFYNWVVQLHEEHHQRTVYKRYRNLVFKELQAQKNLLSKSQQHRQAMQNCSTLVQVFDYIRTSPKNDADILMARKAIKRNMIRNYNSWTGWIVQTKNYAMDDLQAYCTSWTALLRLLKFLPGAMISRIPLKSSFKLPTWFNQGKSPNSP